MSRLALVPQYALLDDPGPANYAAWRESSGEMPQLFETSPQEPFACAMEWLSLGEVNIGYAQFSAQHYLRSQQRAARDDYDQVIINCRFFGGARGDFADRSIDAGDGTIVVNDLSMPQEHVSEASDTAGIVLTRDHAEALFGPVRALHGHVVPPAQAALAIAHLRALRRNAPDLPLSAAPMLGRTVLDLITMAIQTSRHAEVTDVPMRERVLTVQLREVIERELGSSMLNAARLTRLLGVSRSTLYRLLEPEGGLQAYIRRRRLERVADALRDPRERDTLSALAERWGFCDAAYLGRVFRESFGVTPGDYREAHQLR